MNYPKSIAESLICLSLVRPVIEPPKIPTPDIKREHPAEPDEGHEEIPEGYVQLTASIGVSIAGGGSQGEDALLLEDGGFLLLEDGGHLLLER